MLINSKYILISILIMRTHKPCMSNYGYNHNPHYCNSSSNPGGSDMINYDMQDLITNSHHSKSDPCLLMISSAESSTCSHLKLEGIIKSNPVCKPASINVNLKKSELSVPNHSSKHITIKKSANIAPTNAVNDGMKEIKHSTYIIDDDAQKYNAVVVSNYDSISVCSMCGDVGMEELLFLCVKCSHRHQHLYCSRSYPDMGGEVSMCNWCLHEEDSLTSSAVKASEANGTNAHAITNLIKELNHPAADGNQASQAEGKAEVVEDDEGDDADHMVMVKKGHSKAFEYLLLVAAQSLPQDDQVISEANPDLKQVNHTASMINISNSKMDALVRKAKMKLDIKVNMSPLDNNNREVNLGAGNMSSMNVSKKLMMGLDNNRQIMDLHNRKGDLHSRLNISLDDHKMDVVNGFGGNVPKRQRCSKGIHASLKSRKKGLPLSPSRPNYRRYKLLADVVC